MINMEKQSKRTTIPLILVFVIIAGMLAISFYYLYLAVQASIRGALDETFYNALLGAIGVGISLYMTYIIGVRRYSQKPLPRIFSVVECKKCGFKSLNKFQKGDYIFKSDGNCQKCNEPMLITSIYAEETKKK